MRSRRVAVLLLSLVLGAIAAFGCYEYLSGAQTRAYANARMVKVYVLAQPVPRGVSGDQAVSAHLIQVEELPAQFRPSTAVTNLAVILGKVAVANLPQGQVLVDGLFASAQSSQLTFSRTIPAGDVAVSVSVDQVHEVAGFPVPGDLVDILVSSPGGERYLLQNVPILAIAGSTVSQPGATGQAESSTATTQPPASHAGGLVTFGVPPLSAEKIVMAAQSGGIWLALVPPDNKPAPVPPADQGNLFSGPITPS